MTAVVAPSPRHVARIPGWLVKENSRMPPDVGAVHPQTTAANMGVGVIHTSEGVNTALHRKVPEAGIVIISVRVAQRYVKL